LIWFGGFVMYFSFLDSLQRWPNLSVTKWIGGFLPRSSWMHSGFFYLQYWRQGGAEESLAQHLLVLKDFYCRAKLVNGGQPLVDGGSPYIAPKMLSASTLDNQ
jgi:hypothetical protein